MRRVKIIATLGPATQSEEKIEALIRAGVDVVRLNFSHGNHEVHLEYLRRVRRIAEELGRSVALLQDLQGVKLRTGSLKNEDSVKLEEGSPFTLTTRPIQGDATQVAVNYEELPRDVEEGDRILLSDGLIELVVVSKTANEVHCKILVGGRLYENQGINLPGSSVQAPSLTDKDLEDLEFGVSNQVDFIALSFVRQKEDILKLKDELQKRNADIPVIAKIEKPEAVEKLKEILESVDGVMVARGDLGVEMSPERVPVIQKRAVQLASRLNKFSIIATQMLDSMIRHPLPTRAEASDVANAVFDGADALMLSGETAIGEYPVKTVEMMVRIIDQAEKVATEFRVPSEPEQAHLQVAAAVCEAATRAATFVSARAIVAFSQSGFTAKLISNMRPKTQIFAFTPHEWVANRMSLYWGVQPMLMEEIQNVDELIIKLEQVLKEAGLAEEGDKLAILAGAPIIERGSTNLMKLHEVK